MRLSETDVLTAYEYLVAEVSVSSYLVEPDDRRQVCRMGLLYAIRTWRAGMIPFETYARRCMTMFLKAEEREARRSKRAEAGLSLDMRVSFDSQNETTYADLIPAYNEDFTVIEVRDFIRSHQREITCRNYAALRRDATECFIRG